MTGCFLRGAVLRAARPCTKCSSGLVPRLDNASLYIAIGILGATVMPHNLYLHSALVQTRRIGKSIAEKREACRFNLVDSVVALNGALIVNAAILILAAAVFFNRHIIVDEIEQAHELLAPLLGTTHRQRLVRGGAACQRPILHADRNLRGPDRDGRISQPAHAALAAAPDHPHPGDHSRGDHHPDLRRSRPRCSCCC